MKIDVQTAERLIILNLVVDLNTQRKFLLDEIHSQMQTLNSKQE